MSSIINTIDIYSPSIGFSIARRDGSQLDDYTLTWTGQTIVDRTPTSSSGTKTFSNHGPAAKLIPVGISIKFTPNFANLPSNNKIIQHKWSFGDGYSSLITSPLVSPDDGSVYHIYDPGLVSVVSGSNCLTATLTAIDQYQRHVRAYKTIYLYQP